MKATEQEKSLMRKRYALLKKKKLCIGCMAPIVDNRARCQKCITRTSAGNRERYKNRVAKGNCAKCGEINMSPWVLCHKCRDVASNISLVNLYGITLEQKRELWFKQKSLCRICHRSFRIDDLQVDHCHVRQNVRGLLCGQCNLFLGYLETAPIVIENASDYLGWGSCRG